MYTIARYVAPEHIDGDFVTEDGVWDLLYAPTVKHETRVAIERWLTDIIDKNKPKKIQDDVSIHSYYSETFGVITMFEINNKPWFVGKEIASRLGYKNTRNAILTHVPPGEKTTRMIDRFGYYRKMVLITEKGLYSLIMGSRLPEADNFRKWIQETVINSIRKDNSYSARQAKAIQKIMAEYDSMRNELEILKEKVKNS